MGTYRDEADESVGSNYYTLRAEALRLAEGRHNEASTVASVTFAVLALAEQLQGLRRDLDPEGDS